MADGMPRKLFSKYQLFRRIVNGIPLSRIAVSAPRWSGAKKTGWSAVGVGIEV
jgi:hypothetical protein